MIAGRVWLLPALNGAKKREGPPQRERERGYPPVPLSSRRVAGVKGRHAYENLQKLEVLKYSQQTCILPAFEEDGVYGCGPPHRSAQIILHESLVDDAFLSRSMQVVLREARNSRLKIGGPTSSPRAERSERLLRGELL